MSNYFLQFFSLSLKKSTLLMCWKCRENVDLQNICISVDMKDFIFGIDDT